MRPAIRLRVAHLRGAPPGTKRPYVRYKYNYIYTDSEIIVLTRWGSLRLAPINIADKSGLASARPIIVFQAVRRAVVGGVSDHQVK